MTQAMCSVRHWQLFPFVRHVEGDRLAVRGRNDCAGFVRPINHNAACAERVQRLRVGMSVRIALPAADDRVKGIDRLKKIFGSRVFAAVMADLIHVRRDIYARL